MSSDSEDNVSLDEYEEGDQPELIDEEMVEPGSIGTWNALKLAAAVILLLLFTGFLVGLTIFLWPKGK